jgi:hypothetical protein
MAVNKNFVVKNGIEVNTNLIVADTDSNKVGIGTTVPEYTLHVFEGTGIGASMVYVTGISTSLEEFNVGVGGTTFTAISNAAAGIAGSVGVGTDLPGYLLEVHAPVSTGQTALYVKGDMHVTGDINLDDITLNELKVTGISTFEDNIFVGSAATVGLHTVHFADHAKAMFGDGEDLKIYHDETSSYVDNSTGGVYIRNLSNDQDIFLQSDDGSGGVANYILCNGSSGQVELFHYGTARFNTNTIGVVATGTFESTGITTLASAGGISTTGGDLYIGGDLYVSDNITLDTNLNILGIATIATLRVSDTATGESGTEALIVGTGLSVRGSSTGVAVTLAGAGGITTTGGDFYVGGDLYISEDVILDTNLEIIGIATIGTLQVSSTSGINTILSTVESTSKDTGSLVLEGGLGVEKQLYVGAGASVGAGLTVAGDISGTGDFTLTDTDAGSAAGPELKLYRNSSSPADSDYLGQIKFAGESDTGAERNYAKITGKIKDASNGTEDGIIEIAHIKAGSQNISARWNSETLQLLNETQISIAGTTTIGTGIGVTTILDEDDMASDSATALASQQSIKAYVDTQITAEDLDFAGDSGTGSVDLDSQSLTIAGTANEIETSASSQTLTIGLPDFVTVSNGLNVTGNGSTTTTLNVSGISTFSEDILIGTAATVGFGSTAFFRDDAKAIFGDSDDLQIYHNGTNSYISDTGTGYLILQSNRFEVTNAAGNESIINSTQNGSVELYYDNSKKFETTDSGAIITGITTVTDTVKAADGHVELLLDSGNGRIKLNSSGDATNIDLFGSDGSATFKGDLTIADKIIHDGDTNTAIRFPAADTFTVETAGSERLRIKSNGNIGIATADPAQKLHIFGNSATTALSIGDNGLTEPYVLLEADASDNVSTLHSRGNHPLTFEIQQSEKVRITSGGRVGIGSDAPISPLNILTSDDSVIVLKSTDANAYIAFNDSDSSSDFANRVGTVSDGLYFNTGGGGERFRITSTGAWAIEGASNYGTSGQVLTSNGNDAPTWQDASGGGGGGGITTSHQEVQSTSATGISTFSTTTFRSAHMLVGITQGTSYQTGRYLIIHDNTTPTILEESALATGDMLGTFDATIAGGNLTVRVTMGNAGLATVAVKMDTINSDSSS